MQNLTITYVHVDANDKDCAPYKSLKNLTLIQCPILNTDFFQHFTELETLNFIFCSWTLPKENRLKAFDLLPMLQLRPSHSYLRKQNAENQEISTLDQVTEQVKRLSSDMCLSFEKKTTQNLNV